MTTITRTLILLLVAFLSCYATTITLTGAPTGTVGPYNLSIDGISAQGVCVTADIEISVGQSWQATEYTVTDFSAPVQTQYLEAEWLIKQFPLNLGDYNGIHDTIWDIFEPGTYSGGTIASWMNLASVNYGSVDPYSFEVYVPIPVNSSQTFIVQAEAPEPGTLLMVGSALLLFGSFLRKYNHSR